MARRCFLHVGSPKTGTTYLQNVVWASRRQLRTQGLVLPLERQDHFSLSLLLRDRVDPEIDGDEVTGVLDQLAEAVRATEDDVLISHELLASAEPDRVSLLLDRLADREVHVIVTVRDWERQLPAGWQQHVKTRHTGDLVDFVDRVRTNPEHTFRMNQTFHDVARRWGATLPPDRVHVVTVPPRGAPPGLLLERYCEVLGVDPGPLVTDVGRPNVSMGQEQTELLRRVNLALGDRLPRPRTGYNRAVKFWFAEQVLGPTEGTRMVLPEAARGMVAEAAEEQIREIGAAGWHVVGDLADLRPGPAAEDDSGVARTDDPAVLLGLAVEGLAATLTQRSEDMQTMRDLRRQLARAREHSVGNAVRRSRPGRWARGVRDRLRAGGRRGRG